MPLYFFDFDGARDQSDGVEFDTPTDAYNDARRAVTEVLEELTIDIDQAIPLKCRCTIRAEDGTIVGTICVEGFEEKVYLTANPSTNFEKHQGPSMSPFETILPSHAASAEVA